MKMSAYKNYDDLPLFLNASMVSQCRRPVATS